MKTVVVKINEKNIDLQKIRKAGDIIKIGGLVVFPTETVYGLGANVFSISGLKKIYKAKNRPTDNPLIIHICKKEDINLLAQNIPHICWKLIDKF